MCVVIPERADVAGFEGFVGMFGGIFDLLSPTSAIAGVVPGSQNACVGKEECASRATASVSVGP